MAKLVLFHGTSEKNAKDIEKNGFVAGKSYNWKIKSKEGFVYLSSAYAPFYAMNTGKVNLALIKVEVEEEDCYPEDDFLMLTLGKPVYTGEDLREVSLKKNKHLWKDSLKFLGNVAVKPDKIKVVGVKYFNGKHLLMKCDPCITPINFRIMGDYYLKLSEWIFEGKGILEFDNFMNFDSNGLKGGIETECQQNLKI